MKLPEHCCEVLGGRKSFKKDRRKLRPDVQTTEAATRRQIKKANGGTLTGSYRQQQIRTQKKPTARRTWDKVNGWREK